MDVKPITDLLHWFEGKTGDPFFARVVIAILLLVVTALLARVVSRGLRKIFMKEDAALANSSFYFTLVKAAIWVFGICVILDGCFNVNMSAFIAALGIGGIAISLGFQDTLSNLFGGAAITLTGELKPGDNIKVGNFSGVVEDIQWRHTILEVVSGDTVYIPNSYISQNSVEKLPPPEQISVPVAVTTEKPLDSFVDDMLSAAGKAVSEVVEVVEQPTFSCSGVAHYGLDGSISLTIGDASKQSDAIDAVVRAVEPYVR